MTVGVRQNCFAGHHLMEVRRKNNSRTACVCGNNLFSKLSRSKAAAPEFICASITFNVAVLFEKIALSDR